MRWGITGHTRGIGAAIYQHFSARGDSCLGWSRSTGYDISRQSDRVRILEQSQDLDVFVNNAYNDFDDSQLYMLQSITAQWQGQRRIIVNIGSRITEFSSIQGPRLQVYKATKARLDEFCAARTLHRPWIINLKPGYTDTPRVGTVSDVAKIDPQSLPSLIEYIISARDQFHITAVTVGV